jgi:hypothetical protein
MQSGSTALTMIMMLSPGLQPGGIHELQNLQRNHSTAWQDTHAVVNESITGLGFLAQGAGLIGTGYQATDGAAADKINGTLVDKLFEPPPPGQQQQQPPQQPLSEEEQRRLKNLANTAAGNGTKAGPTRVMNRTDGSVKVTVPGVAPLAPPPLPGQKPGTTAPPSAPPPAPPPTEYTTGREDDLDPDNPAVCAFPNDGKPHTCEGNYDDSYRQRLPDLPQLKT